MLIVFAEDRLIVILYGLYNSYPDKILLHML